MIIDSHVQAAADYKTSKLVANLFMRRDKSPGVCILRWSLTQKEISLKSVPGIEDLKVWADVCLNKDNMSWRIA